MYMNCIMNIWVGVLLLESLHGSKKEPIPELQKPFVKKK